MARSTTINAKAYCETPRRLPEVISRKRSGSPTRGIALQHDDPTVHSAHGIQNLLQVVHRVLLDHHFFFFCLSSSNWYLFGPLKQLLVNLQLHNSKKVERTICEWLRIRETDLYGGGIFQFVPVWDRRIKVIRSYAEK
jgi:hypothetical protein